MGVAPARPMAELASMRRRLASMLYESLPTFGVIVVGWLIPQVVLGMAFGVSLHGVLLWLHLFVLLGLYFVLVWRLQGQTLAMQTWSLRIVDAASGKPASTRQLVLRYALAWPSVLLIACGAGALWALLLDRDRQFAHDRLAGTCVVFQPRLRG